MYRKRNPKTKRANKKADPEPEQKKRVLKMIVILSREFPDSKCALDINNPLELLIATILAAQCTDKKVNEVTSKLFKKYRSPEDYVSARLEDLQEDIKSAGFYRNKAKSIKRCCTNLLDTHKGKVPQTMDELLALGGVGRKTANVVLGNAFGIPGIIVDTHVLRLSRRMGFCDEKNPDKVEKALMKVVPKMEWTHFSHLLGDLGRSYCTARKPLCNECPVEHLCPKILG